MLGTVHVDRDTLPWVSYADGAMSQSRVIHARPEDGLLVTEILVQPGWQSELHRHLGPVYGVTSRGRWGHNRNYLYTPSTYIAELPGVAHRFYNSSVTTQAIFISYGDLERLDPDTQEVVARISPTMILDSYMSQCEARGVPRPNVLS